MVQIAQRYEACARKIIFAPDIDELVHMVELDWRAEHLCRAQKGFNDDGDEQVEHNLAADELE